jgi:DNA repair protein RadC
MHVNEWPAQDQPKQKLIQHGPEQLTESELLSILLKTGNKTYTLVDLAKRILKQHSHLQELAQKSFQELLNIPGITKSKAVTLLANFELARRILSVPMEQKMKITDPEVVFQRYGPMLSYLKKEIFKILILNSANLLVRDVTVSEGILNSSLVHPREVFHQAILNAAASIILLHNHPSGETEPSQEDKNITSRLVQSGKIMDIPVLDHIIIGDGKYFSFREGGLIE